MKQIVLILFGVTAALTAAVLIGNAAIQRRDAGPDSFQVQLISKPDVASGDSVTACAIGRSGSGPWTILSPALVGVIQNDTLQFTEVLDVKSRCLNHLVRSGYAVSPARTLSVDWAIEGKIPIEAVRALIRKSLSGNHV